MKRILILLFLFTGTVVFGQSHSFSGIVKDSVDGSALPSATVKLINQKNKDNVLIRITSKSGVFTFPSVKNGEYVVQVSYMGYETYEENLTVQGKDIEDKVIKVVPTAVKMNAVEVVGNAIPAEQKEDTIQYSAKGFKVNKDASAEDLLTKIPGIQKDGSSIKAQGEQVKQVFVDGKPFFGDDPMIALRNLPADLIDRVQVYDRMSDQSQFTGFDDGNTSKAINIITKMTRRNGKFGKLYGGLGTDNRFSGGATVNYFNDEQRITFLGLANNVNKQNFAMQDILGLSTGGGGGMFGGGGGGMGRMIRNAVNTFGSMLNRFGESSGFMVGNQDGNTRTYSSGVSYIDHWDSSLQFNSNYFFNRAVNSNNQFLAREYYSGNASSQVYQENTFSRSTNNNHRLNFKLEYTLDSLNSFILSPKINIQDNNSFSDVSAFTNSQTGLLNTITNNTDRQTKGYNASAELLYRHKFALPGRTISTNITLSANNKNIDASKYSTTRFLNSNGLQLEDQITDQVNNGNSLSANINYTEPVHEDGIVQVTLSQSNSKDRSDKNVSDLDTLLNTYSVRDTSLSNLFDNTYLTRRAGVGYRLRYEGLNASAELNYQQSELTGDQTYPRSFRVEKTFSRFLPSVRLMYRFSRTNFIRFQYNTSINSPSVNQLQNTIDNSNSLQLRAGNPDLDEEFNHRINLSYLTTEVASGKNFFIMLNYNITNNYIGNETFTTNTAVYHPRGVFLPPGAQLTYPVNLNKSQSFRSFINYSFPVSFLMSNLSAFASYTYSKTPASINGLLNQSKTVSIMPGMNLSSNISEDIDFKVTYMPTWFRTRNDAVKLADNEYIIQNASCSANWVFWGETFLKSDLAYNFNSGLSDGIDKQYYMWNAGIGTKILSDNSLELKLEVYDILNQNKNLTRNVTETYIENKTSEVLQRFYLFTVTYNIKAFETN